MSRKRTTDQDTATATISEKPPAETAAAVAEPPAAEPNGDGQTFADRVGQTKRVAIADPFGIAVDYVAGVRLLESKKDRQVAIIFGEGRPEDKPSQEVIARLKESGYRWNPADRIWVHPIRPDSATTTRIDAERLYQEIRGKIRKEKGLEQAQAPEASPF
jgi:hypothetical protein